MVNICTCYCYTCNRSFEALGIARHRAMHRDREEDCKIEYSNGEVMKHNFSLKKNPKMCNAGK